MQVKCDPNFTDYSGKSKTPSVSRGGFELRPNLLVDLGDGTCTYGAATLTDSEALSLF